MPLAQGSPEVTTAVIIVHALERDAHQEYETMLSAAESAGAGSTTLVVAPHYQLPAGQSCGGTVDDPASTDLVWSCDGWKDGAQAIGGPGVLLDSYAVMDQLLSLVSDRSLYPNLQRLVVTGHAAGGQFTLRYAAATASPTAVGAHFLVFNPASYLYLDDARPGPTLTCAADGRCEGSFTSPYVGVSGCAGYDGYPYGAAAPFGAAALKTAAELKATLLSRSLELFVGDLDTLANSEGTDLDTGCEANAQGVDRRSRAFNFHSYLEAQQSAAPLFVIPGCPDHGACLYESSTGLARVFGQ